MTRFDCWEDEHEDAMLRRNRAVAAGAACDPDYDPDPGDFWCGCDDPECRASHDDCDCPKACERHETHACDGCAKARPDADLVHLDAGEKWCPACVLAEFERLEGDWDLSAYAAELAAHGVSLPGGAR